MSCPLVDGSRVPWYALRRSILQGRETVSRARTIIVLGLVALWVAGCASPSERHIKRARRYLNLGNLGRAEREFRRAIIKDPSNAQAYFGLGYVFFRQDRLDEALDLYRRGMAIDPNDPDSHYYMGLIYNEKNMPEKAREEFKLYNKLKKAKRR
jgi:tetratricopeptide (TPR) repeat protein